MSPKRRRVMVVTGETSGEQHMARVMAAMARIEPDLHVEWFGSGGPEMRRQGLDSLADVSTLAAIGPLAALGNAGAYLRLYRRILRESKTRRPDVAVLVDFPEFNLRLARSLKKQSIPVVYFISPQVWAWRTGRVRLVKRYVDRMLVIFPFEEEFYRGQGIEACFVGNPTASLAQLVNSERDGAREIPLVGLLPGSRHKEVEHILPVMLSAADRVFRERPVRFRLLLAPALSRRWMVSQLERWRARHGQLPPLEILPGDEPRHLAGVDCALVKSGTSTLEAMILGVPFAMVYRMSPWSYRLLRPWVGTDSYCLANLVAGEPIAPEFVQENAEPQAISRFVLKLLAEPEHLNQVKQKLKSASEKLSRREAYSEAGRQLAQILKDGC